MLVSQFTQIEMDDASDPIKSVQLGLYDPLSDKSTHNYISMQVNEFTDQNSYVGIFNAEPEPYPFFSIETWSETNESLG